MVSDPKGTVYIQAFHCFLWLYPSDSMIIRKVENMMNSVIHDHKRKPGCVKIPYLVRRRKTSFPHGKMDLGWRLGASGGVLRKKHKAKSLLFHMQINVANIQSIKC